MLNRKTTSVHSQEHWPIEWKAGCEFEYLNILLCLAHQAHNCRLKMCKGSWSSSLILTIRFNSSLVWGLNCCLRRNFRTQALWKRKERTIVINSTLLGHSGHMAVQIQLRSFDRHLTALAAGAQRKASPTQICPQQCPPVLPPGPAKDTVQIARPVCPTM